MTDIDYGGFDALTFDCYGTLIDWEAGLLAGLRPVVAAAGVEASDDDLLGIYAAFEEAAEAGPYQRYREIVADGMRRVATHYGLEVTASQAAAFGDSVGEWPAFADSAAALAQLHERFRLGVITNCDDDLFARSAARLADHVRLGRDAPSRSGATSRTRATSRWRSSGSMSRASGSCTSPRACSTITCRPSGSG